MKRLFVKLLSASLLVWSGCETTTIGLRYTGNYGTYTVTRKVDGTTRAWDVLIDANGKAIIPPDFR